MGLGVLVEHPRRTRKLTAMCDNRPTVEPWGHGAYVVGDVDARGTAAVADDGRRDGYEGARNHDQSPIGPATFHGRMVVETHTAPPASMFDQHDSLPIAHADRAVLTVRNPQAVSDPPQVGAGYVLVGTGGAHLAQYSSGVPSATWSPQQARPVATTIDGAPI
jgi:hypothetical protein